MKEMLTSLELKLLNEVITPSLSQEYYTENFNPMMGRTLTNQSINFTDLIKNIKKFYEGNGGKEWSYLVRESFL